MSMKMKSLDEIMEFFNLKGRSSYLIGVDIGRAALKIVGIRALPHPSILFYSIAELPQGCDDTYITNSIQKALSENKVLAKDAVLTFTDESTVIRRIDLPHVASDEIVDALKWQVKDMVHFDIEKGAIDFELLGEVQREDGAKFMQIIFTAIQKESLEKKIQILKAAGLNVVSVSMPPFGLASIIKIHDDPELSKGALVCEIGHTRTEVSIFKNRALEFVRAVPVGASNISDVLQEHGITAADGSIVTLSKDEIEKVKKTIGISYEDTPVARGITTIQILSLMRPMLERCSKEISRSIEYYIQEYEKEGITAAYLVGGGSNLKNLERFLSEELKIPVKRMSLPRSIDVSRVNFKEEDAVALIPLIGLTLGYKKRLNLLPHEYRVERIEFIEKISLRATAIIAAFVLLALLFLVKFRVDDYRYRLKSVRFQKSILGQIEDLQARVNERMIFMAQARTSEIPVEYIMKELSSVIPRNVVLDNLTLDQKAKTLDMRGVVYEPKGLAQDILTKFMEALERSKYFRDAQLVSVQGATMGREEISNFEISSSLE